MSASLPFLPLASPQAEPTAASACSFHPLEPLSAAEVSAAVATLRASGLAHSTTRIVSISLHEPAKEIVAAFHAAAPQPAAGYAASREAFAVLFDNAANACHEALVSLTRGEVVWKRHVPGVQPTMTIDEQGECEQAVLQSEEFRAALQRHYGITDTRLVMVDIWSAGYYGAAEEAQRRLARPLCFLRTDPTENGYARPIEALRPVVDLNEMRVIRVEEYGVCPLPPGSANSAAHPSGLPILSPCSITPPNDRAARPSYFAF
jgi:primary-amine oxidase